mmetsp:Transcript_34698/g.107856  ORF Transcript_34698/g.107856 Transcript_34698/m.107856 type:complete len:268 (-) Transcript_34698:3131-3934(-)
MGMYAHVCLRAPAVARKNMPGKGEPMACSALHEHRGEVVLRGRVPGPCDPLPPILGLHVKDHLESSSGLPALDQEGRLWRDLLRTPADALAGAGVGHVRVVAKVRVLIHNDVEELAETSELLDVVLANRAAGAEDARVVRVCHHLCARAAGERQPIGVALPALLALPDLLALCLGARGDNDLAVIHLEPDLHQLADGSGDGPHLAAAKIVRATDGHIRRGGVRLPRVDELRRVAVAAKTELLNAAHADLARVLVDTGVGLLHVVEAA